ncbi:MAG: hypothetical protein NVS3B6_03350 [Pseudarthrobacter sp.]
MAGAEKQGDEDPDGGGEPGGDACPQGTRTEGRTDGLIPDGNMRPGDKHDQGESDVGHESERRICGVHQPQPCAPDGYPRQ